MAAEKKGERDFRREAALAMLGAYVAKHGGFGMTRTEQDVHMRQVWGYADAFLAGEDRAIETPAEPASEDEAAPRGRPVHPNDEWAVYDNDRRHRGFTTREEAEFYASARPGSKVVQIGGPEVEANRLVAAAGVS